MSSAIVSRPVAVPSVDGFTPDELKLITDTVAKGATENELRLFLHRCRILNLDPLKPGQIHFIKYGAAPGTIVVGIEGFRTRAARSGQLAGISREVIRNDKGMCIGAKARVHRKDWPFPAEVEVSLAEYTTGKAGWSKMPETMIQKCAEAAALRMAFPDDLGGLYVEEELEKEGERAKLGVHPEQPDVIDGTPVANPVYTVGGGTYVRRTMREIAEHHRDRFLAYVEKNGDAIVSGKKEKPAWWDEMIIQATKAGILPSDPVADPEDGF